MENHEPSLGPILAHLVKIAGLFSVQGSTWVTLRGGLAAHDLTTKVQDIRWEGDVDESKHKEDEPSENLHPAVMALGDAHGRIRDDLGPAQGCVEAEDQCGEDVVVSPHLVVIKEAIKLKAVNVANLHWLNTLIGCPEQLQLGDASEEDEVWWWSEKVIFGVSKSELEQMNRHEDQQKNTSDAKIQVSVHQRALDTDPVPSLREASCDMEQC